MELEQERKEKGEGFSRVRRRTGSEEPVHLPDENDSETEDKNDLYIYIFFPFTDET